MKQAILWTALPAGIDGARTALRLSVLVSPRLDPRPEAAAGTLDDFPAFRDWADQAVEFSVRFGAGPPMAATRTSAAPRSDLWKALFKPSLAVEVFATGDYHERRIAAYPVENVHEHLRRQYGRLGAVTPLDLPPLAMLLQNGWAEVATYAAFRQGVESLVGRRREELDRLYEGKRAIPPRPPAPAMDFFRAGEFFLPRGGDRAADVPRPTFDFHRALAALSEHPYLLELLGLLIRLEVPLDGQPAASTVEVVPRKQFESEDVAARTHYVLDPDAGTFEAASAPGSDVAGGWLRLETPRFGLVQVDTDGAALKAIDFANQLVQQASGRPATAESPTEAGVPALRTGGIALVRTGRAVRLAARLADMASANAALSPATPPELRADEITRGVVVDVEDAGQWRSLCRRHVTYRIMTPGSTVAVPPNADEGALTPSVSHDADPGNQDDILQHEALFHWDGWSLAAPRVGLALMKDGATFEEPAGNEGETPLDIQIEATPEPGSLPRLRFGRTYRLRARAYDLAGRTQSLESQDASAATAPLVYRRFEPVESPRLLLVTKEPLQNLPGESVARMVIRSRNTTEIEDGEPTLDASVRVVLPPRGSVTHLEQYGALDTPAGLDTSAATYARLAEKDKTNLDKSVETAPAEVPYLPDPFCAAAVVRNLPGSGPGALFDIPFDTLPDWWKARPFRITLVEGSGPPQWDPATRVLSVELAKAAVVRARLSSRVLPADLDKLAVWKWIEEEAFDADHAAELRDLALKGLHWMLTPFLDLTLVHAVLQPLARPVILSFLPGKTAGATFAAVTGSVAVHGASTGKLDFTASWTEPTGFGDETVRKAGGGHAFEAAVHDAAASTAAVAGRHEFGDTRYRRVRYLATASTRFREYFTDAETADPAAVSREAESEFEVDVLSSGRPLAPDVQYVIPTFGWESAADARGVSSRRTGGLRVYLAPPWFSSGDGELLGVVVWPGPPDVCVGGTTPVGPFPPRRLPDALKPYATQWGRDPIWVSGPTYALPALENFPRAVAVEGGCRIEEGDAPMAVAGHAVGWDEARGLFYCDIDVDAGASYAPFVRLALARYQPKSVQGVELSRVVLADFVQFAPDRMCWVAREPDDADLLRVMVSGTGYLGNASFPCASTVEVRLERFLDETRGGLGWVPVEGDARPLAGVQSLATLAAWEDRIRLPPHEPGARFRVIVEEYEHFLGDVPDLDLPRPNDWRFGEGTAGRLVYADAVEVAPA